MGYEVESNGDTTYLPVFCVIGILLKYNNRIAQYLLGLYLNYNIYI